MLTALLCLFSITAFAADFEVDGISYNILSTDEHTCEVTSNSSNYAGDIVIPSEVAYDNATWTVTRIGDEAFNGCYDLVSIKIPSSIASIGDEAFRNCNSLKQIEVDADNQVYASVDGILYTKDVSTLMLYPTKKEDENFTIPETVINVSNGAFSQCSYLKSIIIGKSVTSIGKSPFSDCQKIEKIEVDADNQYFATIDNVLYTKNITTVLCCPARKRAQTFTIPETVTEIADGAFSYCQFLNSVVIPNSVTKIGNTAFFCCWGLSNIEIPNSVTSIGNSAFYYCYELTSIKIPDSLSVINFMTFASCSGLTSVEIPNSVTTIDSYAFYGCI